MYIHGGALIGGCRTDFYWPLLRELCDDAGLTVVSLDYRLAPETKLPGITQDLCDAFTWMHEELPRRFDADTERIAVLGVSAGGYLALMSGFCIKPRPRAVVSLYGYGDIAWYSEPSEFYLEQPPVSSDEARAAVGSQPLSGAAMEERGRFYLWCRQHCCWLQEVAGLDPVSDAEELRAYRPICNVSVDYPPTLHVHGTADTDVPYEQAVQMHEALRGHGVESALVTVPNGGHCELGGTEARIVEFLHTALSL